MDINNPFRNFMIVKNDYFEISDEINKKILKIQTSQIKNLEIKYSEMKITGVVSFSDDYDIFNSENISTTPNSLKIKLYQFDSQNNSYSREFKVLNLNKNKANSRFIIELQIQDIFSFNLERCFISKNYNNVKLSDIILEFLNIINSKITKEIETTTISHSNFTIPPTISILDFITEMAKKEGYFLYQTRNSITLKHYKKLLNTSKNSYKYIERVKNHDYLYKIIEYKKVDNFDKKTSENLTIVYDEKTKEMKEYEVKLSNFTKTNLEIENSKNYTTQTFGDENSFGLQNLKDLLNSNKIEIVIPFEIVSNDIFRVFEIEISGNPYISKTLGIDKNLSGDYICLEMIDKIFLGNYQISLIKLAKL